MVTHEEFLIKMSFSRATFEKKKKKIFFLFFSLEKFFYIQFEKFLHISWLKQNAHSSTDEHANIP